MIKFIFNLNKNFKSYQFATESILKYEKIKKDYKYNNKYDFILDFENIKKNQ